MERELPCVKCETTPKVSYIINIKIIKQSKQSTALSLVEKQARTHLELEK